MKLAIVTSSFPLRRDDPAAAAGVFVRDFATAVASRGHDVHVLTQDKGWGCEDAPTTIDVRCFPWRGGARPLASLSLKNVNDLRSMWDFLTSGRRAIVDLHRDAGLDHALAMWAVPGGLFARHLSRVAAVPYSVWCLGSDIWSYGRIPIVKRTVANVLREAGVVFADGLQLAEDARRLAGVPVSFLPSSRQLRDVSPQRLSAAGTGPRFLFVGRYHPVKGVDVLLKAMASFVAREQRGFLYLLGGGPMREQLETMVQDLQLQPHVSVGGYADRQVVVDHAQVCDAFVIPSRMESVPVVFSDALQLGVPIIASDVGDMGTLLRSSSAGLVVPADDASALSLAFSEFAAKSDDCFREGVAELAARFDLDRTVDRFLKEIQR